MNNNKMHQRHILKPSKSEADWV